MPLAVLGNSRGGIQIRVGMQGLPEKPDLAHKTTCHGERYPRDSISVARASVSFIVHLEYAIWSNGR